MWSCDLGWVICENMMDGEGKTFPLGTPELRQRQKRAFVEKSEMYSIPTLSNSAVGLLRPVGEPSRTFLPFRPILFIIHQLGLGRTNLNCRSCRLDESSKRGVPAHTWPERTIWRLNSLSHAAHGLGWPVGRLGQIATVEHNGGVPLRPVTRQFWNCQVAMQTQLLCGQFCHLQYQGKSMTGHFLKWTKVLSIWII